MTRATNARLAGTTFLLYIVLGLASLILFDRASGGADTTARLETLAAHLTPARISLLLGLFTGFVALTLAVTLYALTESVDPHLALLAMLCRVVEGVMAAVSAVASCALLALATNQFPLPPESRTAFASVLLHSDPWFVGTSAFAFAVGSTLFTALFLRGRVVPAPLAWLGLVASLLLVILLPAQQVGHLPRWVVTWMWIPMLLFEVPCGLWLIATGAPIRVSMART